VLLPRGAQRLPDRQIDQVLVRVGRSFRANPLQMA
jgi:hypothetical protein